MVNINTGIILMQLRIISKGNHIARDIGPILLMKLWYILKITFCKGYRCSNNVVKDNI